MLGNQVKLFSLLGFQVSVDASWLLVALLVTYSLATSVFPSFVVGLSDPLYWTMGICGALGLFSSIVLHELAHSVVAKKFGLPIRGITLFIFGGVAHMGGESPTPKAELLMAVAGPLASVLVGFGLLGLSSVGRAGFPVSVRLVLQYLWTINLALAAFNLIPAFPLDGGRVLRSALWKWKGDLNWSTRIAAKIGTGFGFLLLAVGLYFVLQGSTTSGVWWILIGLFLRSAAQSSYRRLPMSSSSPATMGQGAHVRNFMCSSPVTVDANTSVERLVEDFLCEHHHKLYPVVDDAQLVGSTSIRDVKTIPKEAWSSTTVRQILRPCTAQNTIAAGAHAVQALALMRRTGNSRLIVVEEGKLVGVVTIKDLLASFAA